MQMCPGLEIGDAKMCMMKTLPYAAEHDNFAQRFLYSTQSPHDRLHLLRIMTREATTFVRHAIEISQERKCNKASNTSFDFPDPDTFAMDSTFPTASASVVQPSISFPAESISFPTPTACASTMTAAKDIW